MLSTKTFFAYIAVAFTALLVSTMATASTVTTSFTVTANVIKSCSVSASSLNFSNYDVTASTDDTATTTVSVICTSGAAFAVGLDKGSNGSITTRKMKDGSGNLLAYSLYTGATSGSGCGGSTLFGDGTTGSTVAGTGAGPSSTQTVTVYGCIPAGQNAVAANGYTDTITVTVNY